MKIIELLCQEPNITRTEMARQLECSDSTVNSKGVVKAKKKGKVVIKVTAKDGSKKTAKCKVQVK